MDLVFNFPLADDLLAGATFSDGRRVSNSLFQQAQVYTTGRYAPFLSNHDQTRAMTKMVGDENRAKAAASMLLTAPGTPFIYYGEEIGMTGDKPDPNLRAPMQWTGGANAGFTTGTPWKDVSGDYTLRNVEGETRDNASLLSHYRQLINIRANHYALRSGQYVRVTASDKKVYAALRAAEKESVLVLVNMSKEPLQGVTVKWDKSTMRGPYQPILLMGQGQPDTITVNDQGGLTDAQILSELPANSTTIIQYRP